MTYFSHVEVSQTKPRLIGVLGVDGMSSFALSSALEPFAAARISAPPHMGRRCYQTAIIGMERKTFVCDTGAVMKADYTMRTVPPLDTIIIPGGATLRNPEVAERIALWLRERAQKTPRMAAIGAGIFPLARTGLLRGRRITTHWRLAHEVACAFPEVTVSNAVSFVKSEGFFTCGGGIAAMEMSLTMIEEDFGPKTAHTVARELNIDMRPPAGEQQVELPSYQPGVTERLAELPAWMISRLHRDLTVEVLAERACLSQRHFFRLFKQTFKSTPAAFVEQLRINEAQQRLAAQRESVQSVAAAVGFKSATVFRRAFGRKCGMPPSSVLRGAQPLSRNS